MNKLDKQYTDLLLPLIASKEEGFWKNDYELELFIEALFDKHTKMKYTDKTSFINELMEHLCHKIITK